MAINNNEKQAWKRDKERRKTEIERVVSPFSFICSCGWLAAPALLVR